MTNVRPGYWDVDRCCWVGIDPSVLEAPARTAADPSERAIAADLPAPRSGAAEAADDEVPDLQSGTPTPA